MATGPAVGFAGTDLPATTVWESVERIADANRALALASAADEGAHVNMAFYALGPEFDFFFVSEQSTLHGRLLAVRPKASVALWINPPEFGEGLQGMQAHGTVEVARGAVAATAFATYQGRYPAFGVDPSVRDGYIAAEGDGVLYRMRVEALTLIDEPNLGRRNYLHLSVVRGLE